MYRVAQNKKTLNTLSSGGRAPLGPAGELTALRRPLAGFKDRTSKAKGREDRGGMGEGREG